MARVVAFGASQGGVTALVDIVRKLPKDFPATVLIALHVGASRSILPSILNDLKGLHAAHAESGDKLEPSRIYVAPPDQHMLITDGHIELSRGPRENWARPAIDPLFRTVAEAYGPDAIGVVLTGRLNDGTAGLYEIKRRGGIAIVQNPSEAEAPSMPQSALENVPIDYCIPISDMPELLTRLAREPRQAPAFHAPGAGAAMPQSFDRPVAMSCPECGGAMREDALGTLTRFSCHIGHVMTAEVMAAAQIDEIEVQLSAALRGLNEHVALCREMSLKQRKSDNAASAKIWERAAQQAAARESEITGFLQHDWLHPEAKPQD